MPGRTVVIVGAGNIRCSPPVLATLSHWHPEEDEAVVSLFDSNEERLDLIDRLARRIFDDHNKTLTVRASSDLAEALENATDVILSLNEDGSRRMVGGQTTEDLHDVDNEESVLFSRGDTNRPTPVEELSPLTRQLLSRPKTLGLTREDVISQAAAQFAEALDNPPADKEKSPAPRVLSLVRGVQLPFESLAWPAALSESELWQRPHQILRWIHADDQLHPLIEEAKSSPLLTWLN